MQASLGSSGYATKRLNWGHDCKKLCGEYNDLDMNLIVLEVKAFKFSIRLS